MRCGSCLLTPRKGFRILLEAQDQQLCAEQDQFPCRPTGTSSGNRQETETHKVQACHMSRQPLQTILQGTLKPRQHHGGRGNAEWTASKSGHPCPCQNCSQRPPAEQIGGGSLLNRPTCPPDNPVGHGAEVDLKAAKRWPYTLLFCVRQSVSVTSSKRLARVAEVYNTL